MKKIYAVLSLILLSCILTGTVSGLVFQQGAAESVPSDIKETDWHYSYIMAGKVMGIAKGAENGQYKPNESITREAFVTMLMRINENVYLSFDGTETSDTRFLDVSADSWYSYGIARADELGILEGKTEELFGVGDNITREEMATLLKRYLAARDLMLTAENTDGAAFVDASAVSGWAAEAVEYMHGTGLMCGYEDNTFRPQNTATRAEAVTILVRLMERLGIRNILNIDSSDVDKIVIEWDRDAYPPFSYQKSAEITDSTDIKAFVDNLYSIDVSYSEKPRAVAGHYAPHSVKFYDENGEFLGGFSFLRDDMDRLYSISVHIYYFSRGSLDFIFEQIK